MTTSVGAQSAEVILLAAVALSPISLAEHPVNPLLHHPPHLAHAPPPPCRDETRLLRWTATPPGGSYV
eukprot:10170-Eustigmatos_ZCMA.PRE.1